MNIKKKLKYLIKKLSNNPFKIFISFLFFLEISFYFLIFIPFLYINRLLPHSKRILFARFRSNRIGHFAPGFHIRYAKVKLKIYKSKCLYCLNDQISNVFLEKQVRKNFFVNRVISFILIICKKMPALECLIDYEPENSQRDIEGVTQLINMPEFTEKENTFCIEWLRRHGWKGPNQKIVCIHLRDSAYLKDFFKKTIYKNIDWEYHSYRNSDIDDFNEGIDWLLNKGAFVIRTGKSANKRSKINSSNFLDYPFCKEKKDILDIWLFANSNLVISTAAGIDEISAAYKVPRIYLNLLPLIYTPSWTKSLTIPKHLYWKGNKKHLTFEEYVYLKGINSTEQFIKKGIIVKSLSITEINEIIFDGWSYFIEKRNIKNDDLIQTNKFKELIKKEKSLQEFHKVLNKNWIISSNIF